MPVSGVGSVIWTADFSSYAVGATVAIGDETYDQVNGYNPSDISLTVATPGFGSPMKTGNILHTSSSLLAGSIAPLIKIGIFDNPVPFGLGNGTDVLIMGFDVLLETDDDAATTVTNHYYEMQPGGNAGANFNIRKIPRDHLLRMTLVANHSTASIPLPDIDADPGTTELLPSGKFTLISRDLGGRYIDYGTRDITTDGAGFWMRNYLSFGQNDIFYDNFIASNDPGDSINGTPVLELPPNLVPVQGGVNVTNNLTTLDPATEKTFVVGVGALPYENPNFSLDDVPDELAGLTGVRALDERSEYQFSVDVPARGYFLITAISGFDVPPGWKLFREQAARPSFGNFRSDIYYKDYEPNVDYTERLYDATGAILPAPLRLPSASLGFRSLDSLGITDISLNSVEPVDYDVEIPETWVFRGNEPRVISVDINNPTNLSVQADITLQFEGAATVNTISTTTLNPGDNSIEVDISALVPVQGFYWAEFKVNITEGTVASGNWPIAFFDIPAAPTQTAFMFGAYDKSENRSWHSVKRRVYTHAIFYRLRESGFNGVFTNAYVSVDWYLEFMDLAQLYGIQVAARLGNVNNPTWAQPGAGKPFEPIYTSPIPRFYALGDEPNTDQQLANVIADYATVRAVYPNLPLSTTLVGGAMDDPADPFDGTYPVAETGEEYDDFEDQFITANNPVHRMMRHYGIRREHDLLNWETEVLDLSPADGFAMYERSYPGSPWWLVPQAFGDGLVQDASSFRRFPTEAEITAYLHLALANGVRGMMAWPLQIQAVGITDYALYDVNLAGKMASRNGSYPADGYRAVADLVDVHGSLFSEHIPATFTATASHSDVIANTRMDASQAVNYVYAVNLNAEVDRNATSFVVDQLTVGAATDLFTGQTVPVVNNGDGTYTLTVDMAAGQGRLIQLFPDADNDGVLDSIDNCPDDINPGQEDSNNDGIGNVCDADNDGLSNADELVQGTDPNNADSDNDGYRDGAEVQGGSNPLDPASTPNITADGDINLDTLINAADVLLAQRHVLGALTLTQEQIDHGDFSPAPGGDNVLTLPDLLLTTKIALGL